MRAKKNEPVEFLQAPGLISRGGIQIAGGYFTNTIDTSQVNNTTSPTLAPAGVPVTVQLCINGSAYNLDIYSVNGTAYQGTLHYSPTLS
jgi:hypothetical protein